jgi:hypothetical protein
MSAADSKTREGHMRFRIMLAIIITQLTACTLSSAESPTSTPIPNAPTPLVGAIRIDPDAPTPLPITVQPSDLNVNPDGVLCRVSNNNDVSNVAVRRGPSTNAALFYAIQPGFTASVLEVQASGSGPAWYRVRVDNPVQTDLDEVVGWLRSDTMVEVTACPR